MTSNAIRIVTGRVGLKDLDTLRVIFAYNLRSCQTTSCGGMGMLVKIIIIVFLLVILAILYIMFLAGWIEPSAGPVNLTGQG